MALAALKRGVKFDMEYSVDAHAMASLIPHDNYDLVVANSVFEHMKQPFSEGQVTSPPSP